MSEDRKVFGPSHERVSSIETLEGEYFSQANFEQRKTLDPSAFDCDKNNPPELLHLKGAEQDARRMLMHNEYGVGEQRKLSQAMSLSEVSSHHKLAPINFDVNLSHSNHARPLRKALKHK